jgi:hypothetical protein
MRGARANAARARQPGRGRPRAAALGRVQGLRRCAAPAAGGRRGPGARRPRGLHAAALGGHPRQRRGCYAAAARARPPRPRRPAWCCAEVRQRCHPAECALTALGWAACHPCAALKCTSAPPRACGGPLARRARRKRTRAGRHRARAARMPLLAAWTARGVCSTVAWRIGTCADQTVRGEQAGAGRLLGATDLTGSTPAQLAAEKGHRFLAMYLDEAARKHARTQGCAPHGRTPARRRARAWASVRRWRGGARQTAVTEPRAHRSRTGRPGLVRTAHAMRCEAGTRGRRRRLGRSLIDGGAGAGGWRARACCGAWRTRSWRRWCGRSCWCFW